MRWQVEKNSDQFSNIHEAIIHESKIVTHWDHEFSYLDLEDVLTWMEQRCPLFISITGPLVELNDKLCTYSVGHGQMTAVIRAPITQEPIPVRIRDKSLLQKCQLSDSGHSSLRLTSLTDSFLWYCIGTNMNNWKKLVRQPVSPQVIRLRHRVSWNQKLIEFTPLSDGAQSPELDLSECPYLVWSRAGRWNQWLTRSWQNTDSSRDAHCS